MHRGSERVSALFRTPRKLDETCIDRVCFVSSHPVRWLAARSSLAPAALPRRKLSRPRVRTGGARRWRTRVTPSPRPAVMFCVHPLRRWPSTAWPGVRSLRARPAPFPFRRADPSSRILFDACEWLISMCRDVQVPPVCRFLPMLCLILSSCTFCRCAKFLQVVFCTGLAEKRNSFILCEPARFCTGLAVMKFSCMHGVLCFCH